MHPRLFTIPSFHLFGYAMPAFTLHSYGVLIVLGCVLGLLAVYYQSKKAGLDTRATTDMAVSVLFGGLIGAKLMLLVVERQFYWQNPRELLYIFRSGGVFYGGLLGALPVAWWYARRHKLPGWTTADVFSPGVAIGQAIGRLGCFMAGCC